MFCFWDLLYLSVGKRSLLHAPRIKTKTTAELPLKKEQQAAEKTNFCICCFYKLGLVVIVSLQGKDVLEFMRISEIF